jgi:UPF0755 protein
MAKRKNLFLPEPRWTVLRLLRAGLFTAVLFVAAAAAWLAYFAMTPTPVPASSREFVVEHGKSLRAVSEQFARAGLVSEKWGFLVLARVLGDQDALKAGSYAVGEKITPYRLLRKIVSGDFAQAEIRFIEGWNFAQLREQLDGHPAIQHQTRDLPIPEILSRIGAEEKSPEGLFFPDTYVFSVGTSDVAILKQAYLRMRTRLRAAWENRASGLPVSTPYEALILASIVEKETGRNDERELVAAVFSNRLKRGMRLQTDPTVIYGLGPAFDGNLRRRDLVTDTKYNTYTRSGLPPTPIAMAGEASIHAALNPAESPALYFVSKGDGTHQFSSSLVEHNRAVNKYQKMRR